MDEWSHLDHVVTNAKLAHFEDRLFICEVNEAVIKMVIKGRGPTMRHVSRTHRVGLVLLFERNKHVDTKINSRTCSPKEASHMMSGTIFHVC